MLKKVSVITIFSFVYSCNLFADEIKYGYVLQPNSTSDLGNTQYNFNSDADTKNLYGIYYKGTDQTGLTAAPLNIEVINNNTGASNDNLNATAVYIESQNPSAVATVALGDGSNVKVKADTASAVYLKNGQLSGANTNIVAEGKYGATGIILNNSDVNLTGKNTITTNAVNSSIGLSISNNSSFKAEQITINSTTVNGVTTPNIKGIDITKNANQVVDLGSGSIINVAGSKGAMGISINDGSVTAKDLKVTATGSNAKGVIVFNGSFNMTGGSVISDGDGVVVGAVFPTPAIYNHVIDLTDVNISATNTALSIADGTMTLNNVTAISSQGQALAASKNSVTNATDVILQGSDLVVSASEGEVIFSGDNKLIGTTSDSQAIRATYGGSVKTDANGSKMNIVGDLAVAEFGAGLIDLKMNSGSTLTGKSIIHSSAGTVNLDMTDSTWNMTDSSSTTQLALNNSQVNFTNSAFSTLTTEQL